MWSFINMCKAAVPPDNNAQGLYQYIGSLTRPVRYCPGTGLHTLCSRLSRLIINEQPTAMRLLASPEGKLAWQIIGTSEPIIYHD